MIQKLRNSLINRNLYNYSKQISFRLVLPNNRFLCLKTNIKSDDNLKSNQMIQKDIYDEKYFPLTLKKSGNSMNLFKRYFYENKCLRKPKIESFLENSVWNTSCHLFQPKEVVFHAKAQRKRDSEGIVMGKALMWFRDLNLVDNSFMANKMCDKSFKEFYESKNSPIEVTPIDESLKHEMNQFCDDFDNKIKDKILNMCRSSQSKAIFNTEDMETNNEGNGGKGGEGEPFKEAIHSDTENGHSIRNIFNNRSYEEPNEMDLIQREIELNLFLKQRKERQSFDTNFNIIREKISKLPINKFKERILQTISENRVIVISGDTGCGKTTQVPQMIFENEIFNQRSAFTNIVVTEPRRLSAISISERVALEFGEQTVGTTIGYNVRFDKVLPKHSNGALLFCSSGILLRKLGSNPGLKGVSHVIIDEVHERDVIIDFLLVLLKRAVNMNPNIKIILMSASMNANLFVEFFDCPLIEIPGRCYEVKTYYLNDFCDKIGTNYFLNNFSPTNPKLDINLTSDLIKHIHESKEEGAILVFLPGWNEIQTVMKNLNQTHSECDNLLVVPIHSKLPHSSQKLIFSKTSPGVRKVILSTNIAETSLTIDDVVYVVDTGLAKEMRYNPKFNVSNFGTHWISKANAKQRTGRAGRVKEGECYRLYTREVEDKYMDEFPTPELLRIPLENVVMSSKLYCPKELVADFLSDVPQPPTSKAIEKAVHSLKEINVLNKSEELTLLGQRIVNFTTHPRLSVALVYSSFFCCVKSMLALVSQLSASREPFQVMPDQKFLIRQTKNKFSSDFLSDHISLVGLTLEYMNILEQKSWGELRSYQIENYLHRYAMENILETMKLFASHLEQSKVIQEFNWNYVKSDINRNWYQKHLLINALVPAFVPNFVRLIRGDIKNQKLKMDAISPIDVNTGSKVKFSGESAFNINFNVYGQLERLSNSLVVYFKSFYSEDARMLTICDASLISPISLLLFSKQNSVQYINGNECVVSFKNNSQLSFKMRAQDYHLINRWNTVLELMFQWFITLRSNNEENEMIYLFLQDFLQTTEQLLRDTS